MVKYRIKQRREEIGISQAELAKRSGIGRSTLSLLENGYELDTKVSTLKAIAEALHCCVGTLLD